MAKRSSALDEHGASAGYGDPVNREGGEILRCEGLVLGYGQGRKERFRTGPLSCGARAGELTALMGRNGCGKSTLLRTLSGLQTAHKGRIFLENRLLSEYKRRELSRLLGFVSTEVIRVQGLRVRDLVAMGRYPHTGWFGSLSGRDHDRIRRAMKLTSMDVLAERDLDELSDGERQRAMIARTLAQDTQILILDEPTAYLDIAHRFEIISLLGDLARNHGKAVVFSSHDLNLSLRVADKIWLMADQEVLEGAPEDLALSGRLEEGLKRGSTGVGFILDPATGDLAPVKDFRDSVSLQAGSDELGLWTSRSLERLGLKTEGRGSPAMTVRAERKEGIPKWRVEKSGHGMEFNSIYELSLYLRSMV